MRLKILLVKNSFLALLLLVSYYTQAQPMTFGVGADMEKLISISTLLADPEKFKSVPTTISGTIVKVCKKRGCWVELAADKKFQTIIIKVPDGKMVFPMSTLGKKAFATGTLSELKLDLQQTQSHLAHRAEENQTEFDPSSVTKAMTIYRFSPVGVTIVD